MIEPSKYFKRFVELDMKEALSGHFQLLGSNLIVEKIKQPEIKTAGGLIIAQSASQKMTMHDKKASFVRVLRVGKGYYDPETNETIPLDTNEGDILLVSPESVTYFSAFGGLTNYEPETIGIMPENAALMRIKGGDDVFVSIFGLLNTIASEEKEVESGRQAAV